MNLYKKMYHELFNLVTDVILDLQAAQQKVENMYLSAEGADGNNENGGDCKNGDENQEENNQQNHG